MRLCCASKIPAVHFISHRLCFIIEEPLHPASTCENRFLQRADTDRVFQPSYVISSSASPLAEGASLTISSSLVKRELPARNHSITFYPSFYNAFIEFSRNERTKRFLQLQHSRREWSTMLTLTSRFVNEIFESGDVRKGGNNYCRTDFIESLIFFTRPSLRVIINSATIIDPIFDRTVFKAR